MGSDALHDVSEVLLNAKALVIWKDRNVLDRIKLCTRDTALHTLEIYSQKNPFISIQDGGTATFMLGVVELPDGKHGYFKIASMFPNGNAGNPADERHKGLVVDMDGQVGLGTYAPTARLHVVGSVVVEGDVSLTPADSSPIQLGQTIRLLLERVAKLEQEVGELRRGQGE